MNPHRRAGAAVAIASLLAPLGCATPDETGSAATANVEDLASPGREPLAALPPAPSADRREIALGRRLFNDKRFSSDGRVACASCHDLASGGDDGRSVSVGVDSRQGALNAPTVLNASYNLAFFWDGRAKTLEDQIDGPLNSADEMGSSWDRLLGVVRTDAEYRSAFGALYRDGATERTVKRAITTFERSLVTPGAPFDRYLAGDRDAIDARAREGLALFKSVGCVACHQGAAVGGNMFQTFGVFGDYFKDRAATRADLGRYNVTGREEDKRVFRVPSLRNVGRTSPYFHDGSASTLDQAVEIMAEYQLGRTLAGDQVRKIVAFLETLTAPDPQEAR